MPIVNEATLHTAGSAASRRPAAGLTTCSGIRYYLLSWATELGRKATELGRKATELGRKA